MSENPELSSSSGKSLMTFKMLPDFKKSGNVINNLELFLNISKMTNSKYHVFYNI